MSIMIGGKPPKKSTPDSNNGGILSNKDTSDAIKENKTDNKTNKRKPKAKKDN